MIESGAAGICALRPASELEPPKIVENMAAYFLVIPANRIVQ